MPSVRIQSSQNAPMPLVGVEVVYACFGKLLVNVY